MSIDRMQSKDLALFHHTLSSYYATSGRHDMLWRTPDKSGAFDPYKIMVSEIMLQQTQVDRVASKYIEFLAAFPDTSSLANAPLSAVLTVWNGLGYNRRAKYIWQAAQMVQDRFGRRFPETIEELKQLPGIGPNTAGAIMAYAYNQPAIFVETNIRTVIIHHFFQDQTGISDATIVAVITELLGTGPLKPREFYWAMMDYGSFLKRTIGNISRASKSYTKQSTFHGSKRQIRGQVIRLLTAVSYTPEELQKQIADERLMEVVAELIAEGMVREENGTLQLA